MNYLKTCVLALLAVAVLGGTAAAQPTFDDEMYCRFVLYSVLDQQERTPRDVATNTDVGGYYWTSFWVDEELDDGSVERWENWQYWFFPWTVFDDDARQSKGVAIRFEAGWRGGERVWRADAAYPLGFEPFGGRLNDRELCKHYFRDQSKSVEWGVEPLRWMAEEVVMGDCPVLREHTDGPHPAPPGCD